MIIPNNQNNFITVRVGGGGGGAGFKQEQFFSKMKYGCDLGICILSDFNFFNNLAYTKFKVSPVLDVQLWCVETKCVLQFVLLYIPNFTCSI